ncbi:hypothetical protein F5B20DRAFT_148101 [Whalleya microplaca]|nr:hypothetical protein F5B20DRAFT_148101 [Whalleya microplaca]
MAQRLATDLNRSSITSVGDDQFYSAPSSHIGSRHVSLITAPAAANSTTSSLDYLVPVLESDIASTTSAPTSHDRRSTRTWKPRWAMPFATQHQHDPKHHHICRRFHEGNHASSKTTPLVQSFVNKHTEHDSDMLATEPLISSLAPPITTRRWSSVYTGNQFAESPPTSRSYSFVDPRLDGKVGMDRQDINAIVCNIRAYLSDKRHDQCSPPLARPLAANENQTPSSVLQVGETSFGNNSSQENGSSTDSYLVTTSDIAGILEIVIAGLRHIDDQSSPAECLSLLLPKEPIARPTPHLKAIVPMVPSIADPATTISSVQPSFSSTHFSGHRGHYLGATRTTFISRQSITEVH